MTIIKHITPGAILATRFRHVEQEKYRPFIGGCLQSIARHMLDTHEKPRHGGKCGCGLFVAYANGQYTLAQLGTAANACMPAFNQTDLIDFVDVVAATLYEAAKMGVVHNIRIDAIFKEKNKDRQPMNILSCDADMFDELTKRILISGGTIRMEHGVGTAEYEIANPDTGESAIVNVDYAQQDGEPSRAAILATAYYLSRQIHESYEQWRAGLPVFDSPTAREMHEKLLQEKLKLRAAFGDSYDDLLLWAEPQ